MLTYITWHRDDTSSVSAAYLSEVGEVLTDSRPDYVSHGATGSTALTQSNIDALSGSGLSFSSQPPSWW